MTYPDESDAVTGTAPSCRALSIAYVATFPDPEMETRLPASESPRTASISSAKNTAPYPVASVRTSAPPHWTPLPVNMPDSCRLVILRY